MNEDQYNWDEFLTFAKHLTESISGETAARVAIGRAYYAAYWKARLLLEKNGVRIPIQNVHKFVWMCFHESRNAEGAWIRPLGTYLQTLRNHADYRSYPRIKKTDAAKAVIRASHLLKDLEEISEIDKQAALNVAEYLIHESEYRFG